MKKTTPNPADLTFFANLFTRIAEEMGGVLARTAYSPNIKERRDFSCALFDGAGQMIAQAAHIPVHLGAMPLSVATARAAFPKLAVGDVVMLNDPYAGGTHLPDITLISPVFGSAKRQPLAYLATRAHHADVGGMTPGSLPLSREIYQEGLRIPPVRCVERGTINQAVFDLVFANSRTPAERQGDLRAQLAAHTLGERRLLESLERYGAPELRRQMSQLLEYAATLMQATLKQIPDGSYSFVDQLDDDGAGSGPLPIRVEVRIRGDQAEIDFTGSAPACATSLNAVEAITQSAVYYCFLCLLVTPSRLHPGRSSLPPINAGCFRPIAVHAPPGSIVNAEPPHAVAGGNVETSQRIVDAVLGALAQALPDIVPAASQGTMNNVTLGGIDTRTGQPFAYYETLAGGMGARPNADGLHAVQAHMTNTMNTPAEALEYAYPLRVERYEIVAGTGGKGTYRGGNGLIRDVRMLNDTHAVLLTERRTQAPYGLAGGEAGTPGDNGLIRGRQRKRLPGKIELELKAGDVLRIQTPGGGGHGAILT